MQSHPILRAQPPVHLPTWSRTVKLVADDRRRHAPDRQRRRRPLQHQPARRDGPLAVRRWRRGHLSVGRRRGRRVVHQPGRRGIRLALRDGTLKWRVALTPDAPLAWGRESGDFIFSSPTVSNGMVVVGGGDGALHVLEAASAASRWTAPWGIPPQIALAFPLHTFRTLWTLSPRRFDTHVVEAGPLPARHRTRPP